MEVRVAEIGDLPALVELARRFVKESRYGWEFYETASRMRFEGHINEPYSDVLIACEDGRVAGLAIMSWDRDFVAEAVGYIVKFYVDIDFRGTRAGRLLVDAACKWSQSYGCKHLFASATANIDGHKDKMFVNLFGKFGFKEQGVCLVKEVGEQVQS